MTTTIRKRDRAGDRATQELIRDAFWDVYMPGCSEHLVFARLLASEAYVPELDLVAVDEDGLVGQVISTRARIASPDGAVQEVLCGGPIAVRPQSQGRGIGASLMRATIAEAHELGYAALLLIGDPDYYGRFGFVEAATFGITTADGSTFPELQALELMPGALAGMGGAFHYSPAFAVTQPEVDAFDATFPPRDKHVLPGQLFGPVPDEL